MVQRSLEASWVELSDMATVHLLEDDTDLIESHLLAAGQVPTAQFLG